MNAGYSFTLDKFKFTLPTLTSLGSSYTLPSPIPLYLGVGSVLVYALLFFIVFPALLSPGKRPDAAQYQVSVEYFAQIHHGILCVYSTFCCLSVLAYLVATGEFMDTQALFCNPLPPSLRLLSLTFTVSKVVEWVDTAVLFARGKTGAEVGVLHSYHHATTFLLFLLVCNFPSTEKFGMLLNGGVHSIMYYHYAWRLPKWARPLITGTQIAQLVYVTWAWWVTPQVCEAYKGFPGEHQLEFLAPFLMVPVYTILFLEFFVRGYLMGGGKKVEGGRSGRGSKVE